MKYLLLTALLLPVFAHAQLNHYVGGGTYVNYSEVVHGKQPNPFLRTTYRGRFNLSPFVTYTVAFNRLHAGIGFGYWHNGSRVNTSAASGAVDYYVNTKSREHYATLPLSLGYDLLHNGAFKAGIEAKLTGKYIYHLHNEVESSLGRETRDFYWKRLDTLNYNRYSVTAGGGVYASYEIGRFTPVLELGSVYDMGDFNTAGDSTRYLNFYAGLSFRFRLNKQK